jgi:uncharacterized protein (DUF2236 family)
MAIGNSHVERSISAPAAPSMRRRRLAQRGPTIDEGLLGVGLLLGPANVIMQLARPGVGYGVLESRVESGRVDLHPIKRAAPRSPIWPLPAGAATRRRPPSGGP